MPSKLKPYRVGGYPAVLTLSQPGWLAGGDDVSWHVSAPWNATFDTIQTTVKIAEANDCKATIRCYENITDNPVSATLKWELECSGVTANLAGTISSTGTTVQGAGGVAFTTDFVVGQLIEPTSGAQSGVMRKVASITDIDTLVVDFAWPADIAASTTYRRAQEGVIIGSAALGKSLALTRPAQYRQVGKGDLLVLDLDTADAAGRDLLVLLIGTVD